MRPGCDRPAEVRLSYDTVSCHVWLDSIPDRPGPVQEICEFHALRLTVPRGWILCDRRVASPALFIPAGPDRSPGLPTSGVADPAEFASFADDRRANSQGWSPADSARGGTAESAAIRPRRRDSCFPMRS